MTNAAPRANQSASFYESKGMARQIIVMTQESKAKLKEATKAYKLSQGDLIDVLIENVDWSNLSEQLAAKRNSKLVGRSKSIVLAKKLENLSPEQIAAIDAIIKQGKSE